MMNNSEHKNKVFVTQYSNRLSFQEASAHGEVVFLSEDEYRAEPSMPESNDRIRDGIVRKLVDYIPGMDYILVTGSPIPTVIIGAFIGKIPGTHKILKWNNQSRSYDLVKVRIK